MLTLQVPVPFWSSVITQTTLPPDLTVTVPPGLPAGALLLDDPPEPLDDAPAPPDAAPGTPGDVPEAGVPDDEPRRQMPALKAALKAAVAFGVAPFV